MAPTNPSVTTEERKGSSMDANSTAQAAADAAEKKRKLLAKTDPAEAAKRRLEIHVVMIFLSGTICLTLITLGVTTPAIMAFGPFTPSFLQEALDFIKGLS